MRPSPNMNEIVEPDRLIYDPNDNLDENGVPSVLPEMEEEMLKELDWWLSWQPRVKEEPVDDDAQGDDAQVEDTQCPRRAHYR